MTKTLRQIGKAFAIGAGSALDLSGTTSKRNNGTIYQPERAQSAHDGLCQDWQNVGNDIRNAIAGYREEHSV
jgi:hypothetical protein